MNPSLRLVICLIVIVAGGLSGQTTGLTAGTATPSVALQAGRSGAPGIERLSRVVALGESGELDVSNVSGNIVIRSGAGTDAHIEVVKRTQGASPQEAARQLAAVTVDIQERTRRVEIRTVYDRQVRNIRVSVDYEILVPPGTRVTSRSVSGGIQVSGVQGDCRAESVSGPVRLEDVPRLSLATSVSGRVEVNRVSSDGELTLSTVSGRLSAHDVRVRTLDAGSVSGRIELLGVASDRMTVRSVSGRIQLDGTLGRDGRYELRSHSGSILVALEAERGFELDASTFSGSIRTDVPISRVDEGRDARNGRSSRSVRGTSGDGGARLSLTTFSGRIVISPLR